ncbi:hypothetical protein AX16_000016 [Volvariella volvacea WC 439]|nr:hypothetical protein AX16_000016 [Volvariella volvacea WC 439]
MSFVEIRVELPAASHSFVIHVPSSCHILQVKEEIFRTCIGGPRVEGQRLLWRGRYLIDHEKVEDLWKSPDEPRIIHLAVHPSAWTSNPPEVPRPSRTTLTPTPTNSTHNPLPSVSMSNPPHNTFSTAQHYITARLPVPLPSPLAYVQAKHDDALYVLMHGKLPRGPQNGQIADGLRTLAKQFVEMSGYAWADILDTDFPPATPGGLRYEQVVIDGQPYLTLPDSAVQPSPIQVHAIKLLSYTFPLLSLSSQTTSTTHVVPSHPTPLPIDVNHLLRQLELPPLRLAPDRNPIANGPGRLFPLRPLLIPLLFLVFRIGLILYFVAPARKPVFGIMLIGWLLWEMWVPVRVLFLRRVPNLPNGQAAGQPRNDQGARGAPPNDAPGNGGEGRPGERPDRQGVVFLDQLGDMNIQAEEQLLNPTAGAIQPEPGFGQKAMAFLSLMVTTVHPAVWNRRRVALRQREGRIRMEANARAAPQNTDGDSQSQDTRRQEQRAQMRAEMEAQHSRRPEWVRRYIQRVVDSDWVDDAD